MNKGTVTCIDIYLLSPIAESQQSPIFDVPGHEIEYKTEGYLWLLYSHRRVPPSAAWQARNLQLWARLAQSGARSLA